MASSRIDLFNIAKMIWKVGNDAKIYLLKNCINVDKKKFGLFWDL